MLRQLVSLAACGLLRVAGIVARGFDGHFAPRNCKPLMSALGHKRTFHALPLMSALPPEADIPHSRLDVRFVPYAEVAVIRSVELIVQPDAHDVVACCHKLSPH